MVVSRMNNTVSLEQVCRICVRVCVRACVCVRESPSKEVIILSLIWLVRTTYLPD